MLKNLMRDEQPKAHKPHENHIKANMHSHTMGIEDFASTRKVSTTQYFHSPKQRLPNVLNSEHPSTSHWHLTHNHGGDKVGWSMTKNDFTNFKFSQVGTTNKTENGTKKGYLKHDPYHKSILEGFKNQNIANIVSRGQLKDSKSLANTYQHNADIAYKQQAATTKKDLLKSDIGIDTNAKGQIKQSHYQHFCESLNRKTEFPRLKPNSMPRTYNIITNNLREDKGLKHPGFEHFDQNRNKGDGHHMLSQNWTPVPPVKQRFFLY